VPLSDKYLFHHIVKAGGTSLNKLFERVLGPTNVFHAGGQYLYTPLNILMDYRMVTGHFRFTRGAYHDRSRQYITFLRDPLDRVLSAYYYYRSRPDDVQGEHVQLAKQCSFDEFIDLQQPDVRMLVDNHQTFSFGLADPRSYALNGVAALKAAIDVLESYDFVGVYECFPQAVAALCRQMGWASLKRVPHLNRTPDRAGVKDLSRETRERLLAYNGMDHQLYQYFRTKFTSWCPIEAPAESAQEISASQPLQPYNVSTVVASKRMVSFPPGGLGSREVEIMQVVLIGTESPSGNVKAGESLDLAVLFQSHIASEDVSFSFNVWDEVGQLAFAYKSVGKHEPYKVAPNGIYTATFHVKVSLGMGLYSVDAIVHGGSDYQQHCYHYLANATQFEVGGNGAGWFGGHSWLDTDLAVTQVGPIEHALSAIELVSKPARLIAGATAKFQVKVTNQGATPWPSTGPMAVFCCYHILDSQGEKVVWDGVRSPLSEDLAPGAEVQIPVAVTLPDQPGSYVLRLTLLQERVAWFEAQGATPADVPIEVRAAPVSHRGTATV